MGDREFIGDAWMTYLSAGKIPFILRLRENQHVGRAGYDTWTIADIARPLDKGRKMILKNGCRLGQGADERSPLLRIAVARLPTNALLATSFWRWLAPANRATRWPAIARDGPSKLSSPS